MTNPRHRDKQRGSGEAADRAGMPAVTLLAVPEIPPQRHCVYTDAWCKCWPVIESPTMITCQRHFLDDEEAGR